MKKITDDIYYVGVNDHDVDLFEGQYIVPNGMAYNSYLIMDEKIAVMDSVDVRFGDEWIENIKEVLEGKNPDYLVVQHMEPDHSANITKFMDEFPEALVVLSPIALKLMEQFYGQSYENRNMIVKEGDTLELGTHSLNFIGATMVHWPEVIMTYDSTDKVLFSADGFGKFGALDVDEDWACEARRYYFGIVGMHGIHVQKVLAKAANIEIQKILPLHGPILEDNLGYYLDLYNTWSSYGVESEGIMIAYTSVYGHTKAAAEQLKDMLEKKGCPKVALNDLAREDMAECVEDAFRYETIVLATTTYNNEIFPFMKNFIDCLVERKYQNRKIGLIENGSWGPQAAKKMKECFESCENLEFIEPVVTIKSALNEDSQEALKELCDNLI